MAAKHWRAIAALLILSLPLGIQEAHAISITGSRVADTNRNPLAAVNTNVTGYNKANPLVYAIEVDTVNGDRIRSGETTTWYFRVNGGAWTLLSTTSSPAKLVDSPALTENTTVASANRLVNAACGGSGSYVASLKQFESVNPRSASSELRDGPCSETQASIDLSAANYGDDFEFKVTQANDSTLADLIGLAHVIILVPNASYVTASAQSGSVTIYWSRSYKVLIARKAGSAVTDTPVNGTTYAAGNAMGASTVAYSGSVVETSFADTGLANGTTYYYKVFPKTTVPIYASGSAINSAPTSGASGSPTWSYATTGTNMAPRGLGLERQQRPRHGRRERHAGVWLHAAPHRWADPVAPGDASRLLPHSRRERGEYRLRHVLGRIRVRRQHGHGRA